MAKATSAVLLFVELAGSLHPAWLLHPAWRLVYCTQSHTAGLAAGTGERVQLPVHFLQAS